MWRLLLLGPLVTATPPIAHEPYPQPPRLKAGRTDAPVFVFDEDADPSALPAKIQVGGRALEAPSPSVEGTGEDLLYRVAGRGAPPPGTLQNVDVAYRPDRNTGREPWLTYHAVFDPDPIPFKRNNAKDRVMDDGSLVVGDPAHYTLDVVGNQATAGRQLFYGSVLLELEADVAVPLPSIAADSRVLSVESTPDADLQFFKDGADNVFVSSPRKVERLRLNFVMDAPNSWFAATLDPGLSREDVPEALRPELPASFRPKTKRVMEAIGVAAGDSYTGALTKLVTWFREFETGELPPGTGDLYVDLALGKKGVCRHRAYAFVITAQAVGIPARYVTNEAHTFTEVYLPYTGWTRIDLGGAAAGMNVRNAAEKTRHAVDPELDPFGFPERFRSGYSQAASRPEAGGRGSDALKGLPPAAAALAGGTEPEPALGRDRRVKAVAEPFRPRKKDPRAASETWLEGAVATVYRGEVLRLRGSVQSARHDPIAGAEVRLSLLDATRSHVIAVLGTVRCDGQGAFVVEIPIPRTVSPGNWELVAEFPGDERFQPSMSE